MCEPDYGRDEAFQKAYVDAARDPETWKAFSDRFLAGNEANYQSQVVAWREEIKAAKEAAK
jgi:glutaconate CoA-transferase subunit A